MGKRAHCLQTPFPTHASYLEETKGPKLSACWQWAVMSSLLKTVHIWCVNATTWTTRAATYLVKLHTVIPSSGKSGSWREEEKKNTKQTTTKKPHVNI